MVETKSITITLPDSVWSGAIALAEKKNVSLDAVVRDAIVKYERTTVWQELLAYGKERAESSGYGEGDVLGLCRETRLELAGEYASGPKAKQP
jgi:predicted transcriptional regulator